jgi:hypothetical protein
MKLYLIFINQYDIVEYFTSILTEEIAMCKSVPVSFLKKVFHNNQPDTEC